MSGYECARCGHTFTGITLFDRHQDVDYKRTPAVLCKPPASVGLVQEPGGTWTTSEGLKSRERWRTTLASMRSKET